jgi:Papain family cysteine protease
MTDNSTYTITRRDLSEEVVAGKRLGRHVHHDSRSLLYLVEPDGTVGTARWNRVIPVLDQGQVGSCTGNAATGALGTDPDYAALGAQLADGLHLNEAEALKLYSAAEDIDGDGPYPPNDHGSSGLSVAKAAHNAGLISGYTHITSIAAAQTAIQTGPFIVGTDWYTSFDTPDANGLVRIAKDATVRGGHEYECIGYDTDTDLWEMVNSWGTTFGVEGHFFYSTKTFEALLASQGDATVLVPLASPTPTPTPAPQPSTTTVVVDDAAVVAHIEELAAKAKVSPHDYLAARLRSLWHLSGS